MTDDNRYLKDLTTRVRQLILQHKSLTQENDRLRSEIGKRDEEIQTLKKKNRQTERDLESLKIARMISLTDDDVANAKSHLSALIRDVNKCITLLSKSE